MLMQWTYECLFLVINLDGFSEFSIMQLSHVGRKPVYAICEQQRCRSDCESAQSDQRLCCLLPR